MKRFFIFFFCLLTIAGLHAQTEGVSINSTGSDPDASSILDIQSTDKGLLIPRMTTSHRILINNPATGLLVFDTDANTFWFFDGSDWQEIGADITENQSLALSQDSLLISDGTGVSLDDLSANFFTGETIGTEVLDVDQSSVLSINFQISHWQSWTATQDAYLSKFVWYNVASAQKFKGGYARLYKGSGTNSSPIATVVVDNSVMIGDTVFFDGLSILLEKSQQYTLSLRDTVSSFGWQISSGDTYPGGSSSSFLQNDYRFGVYVIPKGISRLIDQSSDTTWNINADTVTASTFIGDGSGLTNINDDLGNHTATQNLELNDNWLSNDGGNEGLRIDNDGMVGIGTASPDVLLHTSSTQTGSATGWKISQGSSNSLIYQTSDGDLVLRKQSQAEQLVVDSDGNVGINTLSPTEQLDVNGNVRIRGGSPQVGQVLTATDTDGTAAWSNLPSIPISLQTKTTGTVSYNNSDDWKQITNAVTIVTGSYQNGDLIKIEGLSSLRLSAGSGTDLFEIRAKLEYPCETVYANLMGYGPDENGINHDNFQIIHYLDFIALSTGQCNGSINVSLEVRNTGDDAWQARDRILFVTKL